MDNFQPSELVLHEKAMAFVQVKQNKKPIALDRVVYSLSEEDPVSFFMSVSSEIGKTMISKS